MRVVRIVTVILFVLTSLSWVVSSFIFELNKDDVKPVITSTKDAIEVSVKDDKKSLLEGLKANDDQDGDITERIMIGEESKFVNKGISEVTYLVFDNHNNVGKYKRSVTYTDYVSPVFELSKPFVYSIGEPVTFLDRLIAIDSIDGDISEKIKVVSSDIDKNSEGVYNLGVEVINRFGDMIKMDFPVNIVKQKKNAPVLDFDSYVIYKKVGSDFNPYTYINNPVLTDGSKLDNGSITFNNMVDMSKPGVYQVVYSYKDQNGSEGTTSLCVIVEE